LPGHGPFALRATVLTPLDAGGSRHLADGIVEVDAAGRIAAVRAAGASEPDAFDLRPLVLLPGMVDLHAHLPQLPNAGLGAGLDLLTWLNRYIFPLEQRWQDPAHAGELSAAAFRAFAARLVEKNNGFACELVIGAKGARVQLDRHAGEGKDGGVYVLIDGSFHPWLGT